jgi:radical SAM protein with 4Fe4S-binding SPASM domain
MNIKFNQINFLVSSLFFNQVVPQPRPLRVRKENRGYTVFSIETLQDLYLSDLGYQILKSFNGKRTIKDSVFYLNKATKKSFASIFWTMVKTVPLLHKSKFLLIPAFPLSKETKIIEKPPSRLSAPNMVSWLMTNRCNLTCLHCGNSKEIKGKSELSTAEAKRFIKYLADAGVFILDISGGEPLMRKDALMLFDYARSLGLEMGMTTNGTLIDKKTALHLKKIGMYNIHISVDGIDKVHDVIRNKNGTYAKALRAIQLFKKHKVPFGITTSVSTLNFSDLDNIKDLVLKEKIRCWELYYAVPLGCMSKKITLNDNQLLQYAKIIDAFRSKLKNECKIFVGDSIGYFEKLNLRDSDFPGCQAGISHIAVDAVGNIKGCPILPSTFIEGNIRKDDLLQIWNSNEHFVYNRKPDKLTKECGSCAHNKECRGGCKSLAYAFTGDFYYNPKCLRTIAIEAKIFK